MKGSSWGRVVAGLLLLVPALIALVVSYVGPTIATVRTSMQDANLFESRDVGFEKYQELGGLGAGSAFSLGLQLAVLPLLTALVLAPALAYAAHRAGRPGRWTMRLAFVVPVVCFAPAALAVAWAPERPGDGPTHVGLLLVEWVTTVGLVCGVAVMLYLAALRRRREEWRPVLVVGGLLAAGAIAAALQTFDYPFLVSQGDGSPALETPVVSVYKRGLIEFRLGEASAIATVLLGVLVVLGLAAVALIIATGTRIEVDPPSRRATPEEPTGRRALAMALGGAGLVAVLAVTAYGLWPWLSGIGRTDLGEAATGLPGATPSRVRLNTWSPALVSAAVGVALAALAGFGIGALRPLGRWSELLLLPFAPWLFVGTGPLAIANFRAAFDDGEVNTFVGLLSPSWLPIPALLVFTLLARGLRRRWERRGAGVRPVLAGVLALADAMPILALVAMATWLVRAQDTLWGILVVSEPSFYTGPVLVHVWAFAYFLLPAPLGLVLPVWVIVGFAAILGVLQITFFDRLSIRTGRTAD